MKWKITNLKTKQTHLCTNKDAVKTLKKDPNYEVKDVKESKDKSDTTSE